MVHWSDLRRHTTVAPARHHSRDVARTGPRDFAQTFDITPSTLRDETLTRAPRRCYSQSDTRTVEPKTEPIGRSSNDPL